MGLTTAIDWTHIPGYTGGTWNPWQGCTKVSEGCKNCYMFRDMKRYGKDPSIVRRSSENTFNLPLKTKEPHAWFVCSWSDFFHEGADQWRDEALQIMNHAPQHLYLLLTKRPERFSSGTIYDKNIWVGVTAENNEMASKRIPMLRNITAGVKFVSVEPMLGLVNIFQFSCPDGAEDIDWVICGGESGNGARSMNPNWAIDLMAQCRVTKTPFFFKQVGGNKKIDGHWGGDLLDGVRYKEFPR